MNSNNRDQYLEKRLERNGAWISEGKIPSSSRVIPINQSLDTLQWVLPTNQVIDILRNSRSFALQNCSCRERYRRCDKPLEVCFLINDAADEAVQKNEAKYVTLEEAVERLKLANEHGLVHLTLYNPEQHVFALCSCCECCCHDIQIMKTYRRTGFITHSDYIAKVDSSKCTNCGMCVERCVFEAQVKESTDSSADTHVVFHPENCYGCGLCKTTCPADAIEMVFRRLPKTV